MEGETEGVGRERREREGKGVRERARTPQGLLDTPFAKS